MNGMSEAPKRLLVVDDHEEFRDLLTWAFVDEGYEVAATDSGTRAMELLARGPFDALIIDLRLPDMDGAEVIRRVRGEGTSIPTVVVSGYAGCLEASRLKELGVERVLPKPVKIQTLLDSVERVVSRGKDIDGR